VLTVTQMLRKHGVVGKFVEFFGDGLQHLPLADRATIANMAPEYGATCGIFPIDAEALTYLRLSGRDEAQIALVEAYAKAQGMWHDANTPHADFSSTLELNLAEVRPSLAGPKRPQDRVLLGDVGKSYRDSLSALTANRKPKSATLERFAGEGGATAVGHDESAMAEGQHVSLNGSAFDLRDGAVVIAAITSCTNTSNPAVMLGAGLLARNAVKKGTQGRAVGQDFARAGFAGRHRLPQEGRRARRPGEARLLRRRLRLHDLHRQFRAAAAGNLQGHRRRRSRCRVGVVGQPQLRRPRASRGQDELPRLAAAGRRVCARRHGRYRSDDPAARHRQRRPARSS
jgi:hypothetical protein